jgi:hypothetical protein
MPNHLKHFAEISSDDDDEVEEGYRNHHHHNRHHHWDRHDYVDRYDYHYITSLGGNGPVLMMIFLMFILLIALAFAKN